MTLGEKTERAETVVAALKSRYPKAVCALHYDGDPWRLLVMGRLSAQCTDARVNIVCETLFKRFPDAAAMADAPIEEIEKIVYSCGVYHVKAKNIKDFSRIIVGEYSGKIPDTMERLLTLPGVGRKIANLILGDIFGQPAIVADTHCIRISNRLGLCDSRAPEKVERQLSAIVEPCERSDFCHRLVMLGRDICRAANPDCADCPFKNFNCIK